MEGFKLKSVKLHKLLGGRTAWTDELWRAALAYVSVNVSKPQAQQMYLYVYWGSKAVGYTPTRQLLEEFRHWPPTVLLGAYDLMRTQTELTGSKWQRFS